MANTFRIQMNDKSMQEVPFEQQTDACIARIDYNLVEN